MLLIGRTCCDEDRPDARGCVPIDRAVAQ